MGISRLTEVELGDLDRARFWADLSGMNGDPISITEWQKLMAVFNAEELGLILSAYVKSATDDDPSEQGLSRVC